MTGKTLPATCWVNYPCECSEIPTLYGDQEGSRKPAKVFALLTLETSSGYPRAVWKPCSPRTWRANTAAPRISCGVRADPGPATGIPNAKRS